MATKKPAAPKPAPAPDTPPASSTLPPVADAGAGAEPEGWPPLYLKITSARDGFRRAGRAWPSTPTRINAADFTAEQLNALALEPMLTITEAAD